MKLTALTTTTLSAALVFSAASAILSSCGNNDTTACDNKKDIVFSLYRTENAYNLKGSAAEYNAERDLTVATRAALLIPEQLFGNKPDALRDAIMTAAFDKNGTASDAAANAYFHKFASESGFTADEIKNDNKYTGNDIYLADGYMTVEGSVESLTENFMSYAISTDTYYPRAANGSSTTRYINYDIASGRILTLSYIFASDKLTDGLTGKIRERAQAMEALVGQTTVESLPADGNFYINNNGDIVFAYQPLEIASHAQGRIDIRFQPYELASLMSANGLQLFRLPAPAAD